MLTLPCTSGKDKGFALEIKIKTEVFKLLF